MQWLAQYAVSRYYARMLAYIHGFNSCAASRTLGLLREVFPQTAALEYPSGGSFSENLAALRTQAENVSTGCAATSPLVLAGASLGGFYAAQLGSLLGTPCLLLNPVIQPALALRPFVGTQIHYYSGEGWEFTLAACQSYAAAPDPRSVCLPRLVVIGLADDLLDPAASLAYWQQDARIHTTADGHSITRLDAVIRDWLATHGAGDCV